MKALPAEEEVQDGSFALQIGCSLMLMAMAEGHKCFFSMPEGSGRDCSWLYSFLGITLYNYLQLYMPCLQNCMLKRRWGAGAEPMPKDTAGVLEEQCALGGREGGAAGQFVISFSNMSISNRLLLSLSP